MGGGLAGLVASIQLARAGVPCTMIERKQYPFHRVCGEYISNEALPFLQAHSLFPAAYQPAQLTRFMLSAADGKNAVMPLDLGGFGISRHAFDFFLYEQAVAAGVTVLLNTEVTDVQFADDVFTVNAGAHALQADVVIGAQGKRSRVDVSMQRPFIQKRSPYVGVKYHLRVQHPDDLIALHNFPGGYCGISNIEAGKTNLCYLAHRDQLKRYGSVPAMEEAVLFQNPLLKEIFLKAQFLLDKPETINEISFETKQPVEHHVLMCGDAAGMITPLCGNGMAMAIHGAKLVVDHVLRFCRDTAFKRADMERLYAQQWRKMFALRLWRGRQIQRLFGSHRASRAAVNLTLYIRPLARAIMRSTHGQPF